MSSKTHARFFRIFNRLQKSDNNSRSNRFEAFLAKLSMRYGVDREEVTCIGLTTVFDISRKKLKSDRALEAYVWRSIRGRVLDYVRREKLSYKSTLVNEAIILEDELIGIPDCNIFRFERKHDFARMFACFQGREWRLLNMINLFGNRKKWLCQQMKITYQQYDYSLNKIRELFCRNGYGLAY